MTKQTQVRSTEEALKLALEALEKHGDAYLGHSDEYQFAITKVKEALMSLQDGAQPAVPQGHEQSTTCGEPVALPEGKKLILVDSSFDDLMYWLERCERKGHLENCADLIEPWEKFDYRNYTHSPVPTAQTKEPEQEPVAWLHWLHGPVRLFLNKDEAMMELDRLNQEYPVDKDARQMKPLYTTPPQRTAAVGEDTRRAWVNATTWRGLTDEEVVHCQQGNIYHFYRCIEAKLKEKNTRNGGCL